MDYMDIITLLRFASNQKKLNWAKRNLDENTYKKVEKSYKDIIKYTVIILLVLILISFIAIGSQIDTMDKYSSDRTRTAHVSGEKIWYIQNDKKEINLSDYGYNYKDYSEGEQFIVYLDKDYNVINISPLKDAKNEKNRPAVIMVGSLILSIIVAVCIFVPIAYNTFGSNWYKFNRWYDKADFSNDKFTI